MPSIKLPAALLLAGVITACGGADDSAAPSTTQGKADWFGNGELNSPCTAYWQCAADRDLTCRPAQAALTRDRWGGPIIDSDCLELGQPGDGCWKNENCAAGLVCQDAGGIHAMGFGFWSTPVYGTTGACVAPAAAD